MRDEGVQGLQDRIRRDLANALNHGGRAYLTSAVLKGRRMIRVSIGSELTERAHVQALWRLLRETAETTP